MNLLEHLRTHLGLSLGGVSKGTGLAKSTVQKMCDGEETSRAAIVLLFLLAQLSDEELVEMVRGFTIQSTHQP